jgi:hypothetical protein
MKKHLLSAAALLALASTSAFAGEANSVLSADLQVGASYEDWNNDPNSTSSGFYGNVAGRFLLPIGENGAMQFDVSSKRAFNIEDAADESIYEAGNHYGAHLLMRDGGNYQLGIFGGLNNSQIDNGETWSGYMYGGEVQAYADNVTLWVQGGLAYQEENDAVSENMDAAFGRLGLRYFMTESSALSMEARYISGTQEDDGIEMDLKTWSWKVGLEHMVSNDTVPMSVFVRYEGSNTAEDSVEDYDLYETTSHAVMFGVNVKLGTKDLLEQDRKGANTDMDFSILDGADAFYDYDYIL